MASAGVCEACEGALCAESAAAATTISDNRPARETFIFECGEESGSLSNPDGGITFGSTWSF